MKLLTNVLSLSILASLLMFSSACETSKIAYGNSYYFKATPKPDVKAETVSVPQADKLEVNLKKDAGSLPDFENRVLEVEQKIEKLKSTQQKLEEAKEASSELSRSEKRKLVKEEKDQRKAIKKEVKSLAKEYKQSPERLEELEKVSGNLRTGIILGAVGAVLVIIGGPLLYTIGAILLVVGLVLILLDVL